MMTKFWPLPQCQARLERTGTVSRFQVFHRQSRRSSSGIGGGRTGDSSADRILQSTGVHRLPATERDPDTEEIPRHVIGTPRDSESEDTVSVGRVSWDGVVGGEEAIARANPFETSDGRSDVGSAASEDREADALSEEEPEVREVVITPAVRAGLAWLDHVNLVKVFQHRASRCEQHCKQCWVVMRGTMSDRREVGSCCS